jgi:hypothetical protein
MRKFVKNHGFFPQTGKNNMALDECQSKSGSTVLPIAIAPLNQTHRDYIHSRLPVSPHMSVSSFMIFRAAADKCGP